MRKRDRKRECVCMLEREGGRERDKERECVYVRERGERGRERERE